MQSYGKKFSGNSANELIQAHGDLFVYESAVITSGDEKIIVKPEGGNEIVLRRGQSFRLTNETNAFAVRAYDGAAVLDCSFVIGSGEFWDSNTNNVVKLDATFANTVALEPGASLKLVNTAAERVPVSLDTAQTLPVTIQGVVNIGGSSVSYTHSYANNEMDAKTAQVILAPASNVNGAYLECVSVAAGNAGASQGITVSIIAKVSAPANNVDGDVLFVATTGVGQTSSTTPNAINVESLRRIYIAPGKGIYLNQVLPQSMQPNVCNKTVLYTLL